MNAKNRFPLLTILGLVLFTVNICAQTPKADLLDIRFNADGTASDVSGQKRMIVSSQTLPSVTFNDTYNLHAATFTGTGNDYYYFESKAPMDGKRFTSDTTIYINYVGRLLNGTIFDTNIKDTAKFYGVYSASRTYAPSSVTISKGENDELTVKMGSSSVIDGFKEAILKMGPYAKGVSVFYSTLGYGTSGSGSTIPGYGPLRFDIEVVNKS